MTTFPATTTNTNTASAIPAPNSLPGTSGPATEDDLGPVTYRPGAIPGAAGLVLYAVISIHGRLTIVAATPADAPVHTRTGAPAPARCADALSPRASPPGPPQR
jgi:hypothetical protein